MHPAGPTSGSSEIVSMRVKNQNQETKGSARSTPQLKKRSTGREEDQLEPYVVDQWLQRLYYTSYG